MPEFDSTLEYRDVVGFPGYKVGNDGSVWSCWEVYSLGYGGGFGSRLSASWRRMNPTPTGKTDHLSVQLRRDGRYWSYKVHRLVLEAFIGPCPKGMQCCHDPDPTPTNNALGNLRWDTPKANFADSVKHGSRAIYSVWAKNRKTIGSRQVQWQKRRQAANLCTICGKNPLKTETLCEVCLTKKAS